MKKWIKDFKEFKETIDSNQKILYVFDFDDTLGETPSFEELSKPYLTLETKEIKELLDKSLDLIDATIKDLKWADGRIYLEDPQELKKITGNWTRKGKRIYLSTPNKFDYLEESFPKTLKEANIIYSYVDDKCIVTARPEGSRRLLEKTLQELGLEIPKLGIWMRPDYLNNAGDWKGYQISELVKNFGFDEVVFFDDNAKYIKKVKKVMTELLPQIKLTCYKVT
jgi:hypothetical protein